MSRRSSRLDFDEVIDAAVRQGINVRTDRNGHVIFTAERGVVKTRRTEIGTGGVRQERSLLQRLKRIGLMWPAPPPQVEVAPSVYPSVAHVKTQPAMQITEQVVESYTIEEVPQNENREDAAAVNQPRTGVPEGWTRSLANTKEYRAEQKVKAREFLMDFLGDGNPKTVEEVRTAAIDNGLTFERVYQESRYLPIVKKGHGPGNPGTWELQEDPGAPEDQHCDQPAEEPPFGAQRPAEGFLEPMYGGGSTVDPEAERIAAEEEAEEEAWARGEESPRHPLDVEHDKAFRTQERPYAYWPLGDTGMTAVDVSGNDLHGKLYDPTTLAIAELIEKDLLEPRQRELAERYQRLEEENRRLRQELADVKHQQQHDWEAIEKKAQEAAIKAALEAVAPLRKRS